MTRLQRELDGIAVLLIASLLLCLVLPLDRWAVPLVAGYALGRALAFLEDRR